MTDDVREIYRSSRRVIWTKEKLVLHVELSDQGVDWADLVMSGTGGPQSGELISRLRNGKWIPAVPEEHLDIVEQMRNLPYSGVGAGA